MNTLRLLKSLRSKVFFGVLAGLLLVTLVAEVMLYRQAVSFAEKELFGSLKRYAIALEKIVYLSPEDRLTVYPDWEDRLKLAREDRTKYFEFKTMDGVFITDSHNLGGDSLPEIGRDHGHQLVDYGNILLGVYEYHFALTNNANEQHPFKLLVAENTGLITDARMTTIQTLLLFTPVAVVAAFMISFGLSTVILSSISTFRSRVSALELSDSYTHLNLTAVDKEMIPLGKAINNYIDKLNQTVKQESRVLADTAHELRIPLKNMHKEISNLSNGKPGSDELALGLNKIETNVLGLQHMTDNMLMLYRVESGKYRPRLSLIDLKEELKVGSRVLFKEATFDLSLHGDSVMVCSNRSVINLILTQLIYNACQYAAGSPIDISWHRVDEKVVLHVDDAGPGIPESERERIFGRLYRFEDLNQAHSSGSGIGLALVRLYAKAVNATTQCMGSPAGGARFSVTFPGDCAVNKSSSALLEG